MVFIDSEGVDCFPTGWYCNLLDLDSILVQLGEGRINLRRSSDGWAGWDWKQQGAISKERSRHDLVRHRSGGRIHAS
ncbi:MAG: hypothetical protein BWY17_02813 [Deltaproteobacteria bacterium ADurb.Bin207]|nr:MAG: hypothetical protein BWY17_02813 [Deltaproteobacteria bacterium ADurb.Bin207]